MPREPKTQQATTTDDAPTTEAPTSTPRFCLEGHAEFTEECEACEARLRSLMSQPAVMQQAPYTDRGVLRELRSYVVADAKEEALELVDVLVFRALLREQQAHDDEARQRAGQRFGEWKQGDMSRCPRCGKPFEQNEARYVVEMPGHWSLPIRFAVHQLCRFFGPGEQVPTDQGELVNTIERKLHAHRPVPGILP